MDIQKLHLIYKTFDEMSKMGLSDIGLSQLVMDQLRTVGREKNAPPLETLEMSLRQHFGLPVPEKWKVDSWIQSGVEIVSNFSR